MDLNEANAFTEAANRIAKVEEDIKNALKEASQSLEAQAAIFQEAVQRADRHMAELQAVLTQWQSRLST